MIWLGRHRKTYCRSEQVAPAVIECVVHMPKSIHLLEIFRKLDSGAGDVRFKISWSTLHIEQVFRGLHQQLRTAAFYN